MEYLIYVVFFAALAGGYFPARRNGLSRLKAFGLAALLALLFAGLVKFIFFT